MSDLDAFLSKGSPQVVEQPKAEAAVPEVKAETPQESEQQKADRERDEKGRFAKKAEAPTPEKPEAPKAPEAPKVEKPAATTAAEKAKEPDADAELPPKGHVPVKVALEERRKRQILERRIAALESRPPQAQPAQSPAQEQQQSAGPDLSAVEENLKANLSYALAKRQYPDFEEVMQEWPLLIHDQPWLYKQAMADELPAEWAYKHVKRQRFLQEVGNDTEGWREKERAAIRAELEAEFAQRPAQQPAPRSAPPVPPPSLASAPSTGNQHKPPEWKGPTPFQNLFKGK